MNSIFSKYLIFIFALTGVVFLSCKKSKDDGSTCCCPEQTTPSSPPQRLVDLYGNGFFIMKKYYTINGSSVTYDSCLNYASEMKRYVGVSPYNYNGCASYGPDGYMFDSIKVNSIKFKDDRYTCGYHDTTNTLFAPPFKFEFYGDTSLFDIINYTDNDLTVPNYTGFSSLPDSVSYNKGDLLITVGSRVNTKETKVFTYTDRFPYLKGFYVENDQNSYTIPYNSLPYDWHTDKLKYEISLRNWTSKTINGRNYYFVCENIYYKK